MIKINLPVWLKWTLGILGGLIVVFGCVIWYFSVHWRPILEAKIKDTVKSSTDSLYTIDFTNLHLNLLTGNLSLDSIDFKPDTSVYNDLKDKGAAPGNLYSAKITSLIFNRVAILHAYFDKEISLKTIVIDRPDLKVVKYSSKNDTSQKGKTLYEMISKSLKSIHIQNIVLNDADLNYTNRTKGTPKTSILENLSVKVTDLLIDSASQFDKSRFYYTKDIFFEIKDYKAKTSDKMYTMSFDDFSGSVSKKQGKLKGFKLVPVYPELEFSRKYKIQHDRYTLSFPEIDFTGLDFDEFDENERLLADKIEISNANVAVFLNRSLPPASIDKKINFPHIALKRLPIETRIKTMQLNNVDIAYTEYNPQSSKKGTLTFKKLSGIIKNVTNDDASLKMSNHAIANLSAYLMGKGRIDVTINFNLTDPNGAFSYKGSMGRLDLRTLAPLARDLALIEIESGIVSKANFYVNGNVKGSTGNLNLYYTDLKVKLLKKDEETHKLEKKGLLSFLANTAVIINDNPRKGEELRKGPISFSRPPSASFFNEMWKSVFVGMREAVGLGIVPMKSQEAMNEKMQKEAEKNKKRAQRKAKREERKQERKEN